MAGQPIGPKLDWIPRPGVGPVTDPHWHEGRWCGAVGAVQSTGQAVDEDITGPSEPCELFELSARVPRRTAGIGRIPTSSAVVPRGVQSQCASESGQRFLWPALVRSAGRAAPLAGSVLALLDDVGLDSPGAAAVPREHRCKGGNSATDGPASVYKLEIKLKVPVAWLVVLVALVI